MKNILVLASLCFTLACKAQYSVQTANGCALKVSRALNYSGITIPQITTTAGKPGTFGDLMVNIIF